MKRLLNLLLLAIVCAFPKFAEAEEPWKGMNIFRYCMGDTVIFAPAVCRAYIQGAVDAYHTSQKISKEKIKICVPDDTTAKKKGENQVPKWIDFFKERRNERPIVLISDALEDIFPCKK